MKEKTSRSSNIFLKRDIFTITSINDRSNPFSNLPQFFALAVVVAVVVTIVVVVNVVGIFQFKILHHNNIGMYFFIFGVFVVFLFKILHHNYIGMYFLFLVFLFHIAIAKTGTAFFVR